jgi:AAA domain
VTKNLLVAYGQSRAGLRIAFCGASGTGKTTLARKVAELYSIPLCPVGSRSVAAEMGFENPYDVDTAGQREEFQQRLFLDKNNWELRNGNFVTDRTTLDNLTYSMMHDTRGVLPQREVTDPDVFFAKYWIAMRNYTHVFFCPMAAYYNTSDDPIRKKDLRYNMTFERILHGLLIESRHTRVDLIPFPVRSEFRDTKGDPCATYCMTVLGVAPFMAPLLNDQTSMQIRTLGAPGEHVPVEPGYDRFEVVKKIIDLYKP